MNTPALPIYDVLSEARATLLRRDSLRDVRVPAWLAESLRALFGEPVTPDEAVRRIVQSVRENGDAALLDWNRRIDNADLDALAVPQADIDAGLARTPAEVVAALELAADRIRAFHQKQPVTGWIDAGRDGSLGQLVRPVDSVGVYVAGGTAPLPSSLLMSAVPAHADEC